MYLLVAEKSSTQSKVTFEFFREDHNLISASLKKILYAAIFGGKLNLGD